MTIVRLIMNSMRRVTGGETDFAHNQTEMIMCKNGDYRLEL